MMNRSRTVSLLTCALVLAVSAAAAQVPAQPAQERGAGGGRGNGLRTKFQTFYMPGTELFATYIPFVVGQPSRVTAHLTKITDHFEAVASAKVTVTLLAGGVTTETTITTPERSGVFRGMLTPTTAGTGTLVVNVVTPEGAQKFTLDNVTVEPDLSTALAHQGPDPDAGAIRYTKEEGWDSNNFATAPVVTMVVASGRPAVLAVPRTSIVQDQGASYVYVQRDPEAFDLKPVKTGSSNDQAVEVTEGLREGDRIIVKGADKLPRK